MKAIALGARRLGLAALALALALVAPLGACSSNTAAPPADGGAALDGGPAQDGGAMDGGMPADAGTDGGAQARRTMKTRPLFGELHPQNLILDPNFSVRQAGLGNWESMTSDQTQSGPTFSASLFSDSPNGLATPVARLADARGSSDPAELTLVAQVTGGPGPFRLRVWLSTLDVDASASLDGVTIGLLTSLDGAAIQIDEVVEKKAVIGGRTWHLFDGTIAQDLSLGAFLYFDFAPSSNTWLLQAPEFIPAALDPSAGQRARRPRALARTRAMNAREKAAVARYRARPKISVPASHPLLRGDERKRNRR